MRVVEGVIVAVGPSVQTIRVRTSLLEFQLVEEGVRHINTLVANAGGVGAALSDCAGPEVPATRVRKAREEIIVVLLHEKSRVIERISRGRHGIVIDNGEGGNTRSSENGAAGRIAKC